MQKGFPFQIAFTLNFERATAVYDLNAPQPLVLYQDGRVDGVPIDPVMGYRLEIEYFLACIATKRQPQTVTLRDAAEAVRIVEAEVESVKSGSQVQLS